MWLFPAYNLAGSESRFTLSPSSPTSQPHFRASQNPEGKEAWEAQPLDVSILEPRGRRESMKDGSEGAGGEL